MIDKKEVINVIYKSLLLSLSIILIFGGIYKIYIHQYITAIISIILGGLLLYRRFKK